MIQKKQLYSWITVAIFFMATVTIQAQNYTVNSLADTNTGAGTAGTLRWCINQANGAAGPHTITFVAGGIGTILLTSDLPVVSVADVTIDGTSAGGATSVIIDGGAGDNTRRIFRANGGGTNATFRGMTVQDTGNEPFYISGSPTGVTIEDIVVLHNDGNWFNYGINFQGNASGLTVRNFTMTQGQGGWYGIDITGTATNVLIDGYNYSDGGGATAYGIRIRGVANNVTIQNSTIDLDSSSTTNDGDYGIYFDNTTTNVTIDNVIMHDAEVYGIYFGGVATTVDITNFTYDNFNGSDGSGEGIRFNTTASGITMDTITMNGDFNETPNNGSANYGLRFRGVTTNTTLTNVTANNFDSYGISFDSSTDTVTINNFTMLNPQGWTSTRGFYFAGVANNIDINTANIDLDVDFGEDDGDYGMYFAGGGTNINIDDATLKDADSRGIYLEGTFTSFTFTDVTITNVNGSNSAKGIEFLNTINGLVMTGSTIDMDYKGAADTDDGDDGFLCVAIPKSKPINRNSPF